MREGEKNPFYGKHHTEENKEKNRQAHLGKHHSEKTKKKMSLSKKGIPTPHTTGDKNIRWKGDNVKSRGLHEWVRRHLPEPELCQICNLVPPYDLANATGIYNRDLSNWKYYCRRCHILSEGRLSNLKQFR